MSILDFFRRRKRGGSFDPMDNYAYNHRLYDRFERDLRRHALPRFPDPTPAQIAKRMRERQENAQKQCVGMTNEAYAKLLTNLAIPVEVDIWVDKVIDHYFDKFRTVMGMGGMTAAARAQLYKYRGYTWYSYQELHPDVIFD